MHLALNIGSPCEGVPEPGVRRAPAGPTLTSADSTWAGVAGIPSPGPGGPFGAGREAAIGAGFDCRAARFVTPTMLANRSSMAADVPTPRARRSCIDMSHLSVRRHAPTGDRVIVVAVRVAAVRDEIAS